MSRKGREKGVQMTASSKLTGMSQPVARVVPTRQKPIRRDSLVVVNSYLNELRQNANWPRSIRRSPDTRSTTLG